MRVLSAAVLVLATTGLFGCYGMRPSDGSGQAPFEGPRQVRAEDVALPAGYRIEPIATGLTFPTGVAFDEAGRPHVVEAGYAYGEVWTTPRLLRVEPGGALTTVAEGGRNGPWTGVAFADGTFYIAEGGELEGGGILRITPDGQVTRLIAGLPSRGDHHTNGPAIGPDGWIYFAVGTATNSGVVGKDNATMGWLRRSPEFHDIPCRDVTLSGRNFESEDPLHAGQTATTGAFVPFGTVTRSGQVVPGRVPCSGAIMRIPAEGGSPELVAWGFRNPFGLAFSPDGRLYATENSYDERGSRKVFGAGDLLWAVQPGAWHGWPDYHGERRLDDGDRYQPPSEPRPEPLLAQAPGRPPRPVAVLGVHASANGLVFSTSDRFGHRGQAFIAEFGDHSPSTGKVMSPVGAKVVRVDPGTGAIEDFVVNKGPVHGPASWLGSGGIERPVAVRFDPSGTALYIVDFGVLSVSGEQLIPRPGTGVLWRVVRAGGGGG